MNIKEMQDKRNKLLLDAQKILLSGTSDKPLTSDQRASVDAMLADVDIQEADITRLERANVVDTENRSTRPHPLSNPGSAVADSQEEINRRQKIAFDRMIRGDDRNINLPKEVRTRFAKIETRDIITTSTGGTFVPQAFYPELLESQKEWGDLLNIVNEIKSDNGAPTKYAMSDDTSSVMYEETEGTADTNTPEDPALTGAIITTSLLSCSPVLVGWAELQDSEFDITTFVKEILGKRYFRSLSAMCVNGSNSGNIASILTGVAAHNPVTSAVSGTVTYVDIASLYGSIDPAYEPNSTFVMNSTTRAHLLGEVDSLGRPLFLVAPVAGSSAFSTLLGRPVKLVQALPNIAAGNYPILFGDFKLGYLLKTVNPGLGINILRELYAAQFCVGFIPFARAGSAFISPGGTDPIHGLKVHA